MNKARYGTVRGALQQKFNVMTAVALRDMRTRFFNHGLGYLLVPLWPLAHMAVLLAVYTFAKRATPFGESLNIFFGTGLFTTLAFMYISRFMALSIVMNRPMMGFPIVNPLDILIARAFLEITASFLTMIFFMTILWLMGDQPIPGDIYQAIYAYLSVLYLAFSAGVCAGILSIIFKPFVTIYSLFTLIVYILSGTMFVASSMPDAFAIPLSYNPVLQCVEWMRVAYYPTYSDRLLDRAYVLEFSTVLLFLGLSLERAARSKILEG